MILRDAALNGRLVPGFWGIQKAPWESGDG